MSALRGPCPGCKRIKTQENGKHSPEEMRDYHPQRYEFDQATGRTWFTKDFNTAVEALMHDELETAVTRILAWIKRMAWGNYSLYCVDEEGNTLFQSDCAARLGIKKQRVSKVMQYLEQRGYIERRGTSKILFPVVAPSLTGPSPSESEKSPEWATFVEAWKVAHSSDFLELEVARSTVERIRKVMRSDYKQSRAAGTESSAIKEEILESIESKQAGTSSAVEPEPDEPACLPAPTRGRLYALPATGRTRTVPLHRAPSAGVDPTPEDTAPLAGLRTAFPDGFIGSGTLDVLDQHFSEELGEDYDPNAFVAFVARRQIKSKIGTGLVFDRLSGLPRDFIRWSKDQAAERRAAAELDARHERQAAERAERAALALLQDVADNPLSPPEDAAEARAHPGIRPTHPDRARELFDREVIHRLAALERGGSPQWLAECREVLRRAEALDRERVTALRTRK